MHASTERPIWLSGAIVTFLNKLVFPALWFVVVVGLPLSVLIRTGHLSLSRDFFFPAAFAVAGGAFILWLTPRLQRVGYAGRHLVVSNYRQEVRIPFADVESVESVWWYRGRMIRVNFRVMTPFGESIYYLPKWGPIRCLFTSLEQELRDILAR